ncbi:type II toxin-antitoxin system RelE family toxin [Deferribacter abyssi]|uniref:type II toxin-antitoxin system RelE family toxin n=1 Tax=Deferribacter abyssi TaxID=213806 RepID=UPI003C14624C
MNYKIVFTPNAKKQIKKLPKKDAKRILDFLKKQEIKENPRVKGKPLKGNLNEFWRYRVGNYRVIVKIEDNQLVVLVVRIGHRKNIYQD